MKATKIICIFLIALLSIVSCNKVQSTSKVVSTEKTKHTQSVSAIKEVNNVTIEKKNGLILYFPNYNTIEYAYGEMPTPMDSSILFCCSAAFTGKFLEEFKHSNIAGNHVSKGVVYRGFTCGKNSGYFEWKNDNTWNFILGKRPKENLRNAYSSFEQVLVIYDGVKCSKQAQRPTSSNNYRVLAEYNGKLCIIDSDGVSNYTSFLDNLIKSGVKHALYLDMGRGWNFSYYRANDNSINYIHDYRIKYTTNWIVFKK